MKTKKTCTWNTFQCTRQPRKYSVKSDTCVVVRMLHIVNIVQHQWLTTTGRPHILYIYHFVLSTSFDFCQFVILKIIVCRRYYVYFSNHRFIPINMMPQLKSYLFKRNSTGNASDSDFKHMVNRNFISYVYGYF